MSGAAATWPDRRPGARPGAGSRRDRQRRRPTASSPASARRQASAQTAARSTPPASSSRPGLVDLHTHLYPGVSHYGIDAGHVLPGPRRHHGGRRRLVRRPDLPRPAPLRHRARRDPDPRLPAHRRAGHDHEPASASSRTCAGPRPPRRSRGRARTRTCIVGIKVRLGYQMVGNDPVPAMRLAREAADALGLPLMVHVIDMRPPISWLLPYLGRGDVVTHCFHGNEGGILDARGVAVCRGPAGPRARRPVRRRPRRRELRLPGRP